MAKTKTPFMSLGSQGTVGDTLTSQKRDNATILRTKPFPSYTRTLPQAYQRWLYEDYAYLWRQQSDAVKQEYTTGGYRFHLTGFQYWMKYHLANLPDIAAWWKLDDNISPTTRDSSRQGHDLTVIGASPATGIIDRCFSFDGINDYLWVNPTGSLINFTAKTVIFTIQPPAFTGSTRSPYYAAHIQASGGDRFLLRPIANNYRWYYRNTLGVGGWQGGAFTPDVIVQFAMTWDGNLLNFYENGIHVIGPLALTGILSCSGFQTRIGTSSLAHWYNSWIDNVIILRRALDPTEIARWSERRYPAQ